jgi:hypothetical protein
MVLDRPEGGFSDAAELRSAWTGDTPAPPHHMGGGADGK